jgi:glycosyltransferase involved in cell wall biosynthesis
MSLRNEMTAARRGESNNVALSICIPGYNRPYFLKWTLDKLKADFPGAEIVVSDDGSDQPMHYVRNYPGIRWVQQKHIGPFPNLRAALLEAKGKYAAYCANDDYLLPGRVSEAIQYLEDHPEVSAYIAPCEVWDEVEGKAFWNTWGNKEPQTFKGTHEEALRLFNFIIQHHVWPEHGIYRTPVPLRPRTRAYWCFPDLVDLLEKGPIHFGTKPFYRNLLVHPVGERVQLGNVQCLTHFDEYRAGLEVLAYGLFGAANYQARRKIHDMINAFICQRMHVASILYERQGEPLEAEMLRQRVVIANPMPDQEQAAA